MEEGREGITMWACSFFRYDNTIYTSSRNDWEGFCQKIGNALPCEMNEIIFCYVITLIFL